MKFDFYNVTMFVPVIFKPGVKDESNGCIISSAAPFHYPTFLGAEKHSYLVELADKKQWKADLHQHTWPYKYLLSVCVFLSIFLKERPSLEGGHSFFLYKFLNF